jgi:glycosyltransferase involved in cell wall biosynthesis
MKVNIVARPDHSLNLYSQLKKFVPNNVRINLFTFSALRETSIEAKLFPKFKKAPSDSVVLNTFTLVSRILAIFYKKFGLNHMELYKSLFKILAPKKQILDANIVHYWPFYAIDLIREQRSNLKTVAEFYEAEPDYVNSIFESEYIKFGIKSKNRVNKLIDQNECFKFESNIIVASEYTKRSYQIKYPDKNYFICKYGPLGFELDEKELVVDFSINRKIVFVGQICLEKGVHYLIEAVKNLNVTLDLIGPIRSEQKIIFDEMIKKHNNINHLGPMRNSEVLNVLKNYSLFCLPSLSDNYSIAVVEALSKKIPVIVTENCGNADDIVKFGLGFVVPVKDEKKIELAVNYMLENFDYKKFEDGLKLFFSKENQDAYPKSVYESYLKILSSEK